ncbi:MAG: Uncharacterised protein [Cryomorphaceae bacterium]|nr:MAG: Uncharacterised protein [Cryomorphaceae bacterium]
MIKDYKTMTPELMALLVAAYPEGFEYDTVYFTNAKGEKVEAVPLETEDTKYLIKVSTLLEKQFEAFDLEAFEDEETIDKDFDGEALED